MATGQKPHTDIHARLQSLGDWSARFAQTPDAAALAPFAEAFSLAYRDAFPPEDGIADAQTLQALPAEPPLALKLARGTDARQLQLKLYVRGQPASLSRVLPLLENIGFTVESVQPYAIAPDYWLQQYTLTLPAVITPEAVESRLADAFRRIWTGTTDSDRLNALLLVTTLDIGEIAVLRALGKYIIQAGAPYNYEQICAALNANPDAAAALIAAFHAKMRPQAGDATAAFSELQNCLQQVQSAEHEAILRWYFDLLTALLRTNYYQKDANGQPKNRLAFKFAARDIPGLPKPKPLYEIWVYSPKVEGVHLRGGKVARGGLRWSDRHADFRTEVLGLVKAQMVKNAIIVPVGSKGGFVVKNPPADRDAFMEAGKACYRTFIRGLLDLTDNLVEGKIVPPADTVRHDEDDPYLVVAADKGTAKFSDIANQIAAEYRFWLGDAFASGGSAGYDHKGIGITARGAWESVKRHFRLLGKNIQQDDTFTAIGIGDMSGDVFGNGMLLSANTRLLAAFNHLHIFIDPNPDPAASLAERERLFRLPRSTWADYNPALISQGGGVFARSDKTIAISPEMKAAFDIQEDSLPPTELISCLLKAPVDLIWNGGIGTYIKASDETHAQVGDRANDALRINGCEVRAKIIGEGGNLGMTQRGRIEAAQNGVRLNTDAIDNSGGVNCSDHEVNIKILLNQAIEAGELDLAARNALLAEMTDSVAEHVLRQNYLQPQTLSLALARRENLDDYARLMQQLEAEDRLDREPRQTPRRQRQPHRARTRRPPCLQQNVALRPPARLKPAGCAVPPTKPAPLLPGATRGKIQQIHGDTPPAPRNHQHLAYQRPGEPPRHRRHLARQPGERRPAGAGQSLHHRAGNKRRGGAVARNRGAGQPRPRHPANRTRTAPARPSGAQHRSPRPPRRPRRRLGDDHQPAAKTHHRAARHRARATRPKPPARQGRLAKPRPAGSARRAPRRPAAAI